MTRKRSSGPVGPLTEFEKTTLAEADRQVTVRTNGQTQTVTMSQAVIRSNAHTAMEKSPHAQRTYLNNLREASEHNAAVKRQRADYWRECLHEGYRKIALAEARKEPLPNLLPHPDDIEIDAEDNVQINGPICQEEADKFAQNCQLRDMLLRQHVLEIKLGAIPKEPDRIETWSTAYLMANLIEVNLPERMKIGTEGFFKICHEWSGKSKRDMLRDTYQGWKAIGKPMPRGAVLPPAGNALRILEALARAVREGSAPGVDNATRGQIAERTIRELVG